MSFQTIISALRTPDTLAQFIEQRGLYDTIMAVGDVALDAAQFALESSKMARSPKDQVLLALGHLQSAHVAFQKRWKSLDNAWGRTAQWITIDEALVKDIWVCCLMVTCQLYLDEPELAKSSTLLAREALNTRNRVFPDSDDDSTAGFLREGLKVEGRVLLSFLNPSTWRKVLGEIYFGEEDSTDSLISAVFSFKEFEEAVAAYNKR